MSRGFAYANSPLVPVFKYLHVTVVALAIDEQLRTALLMRDSPSSVESTICNHWKCEMRQTNLAKRCSYKIK